MNPARSGLVFGSVCSGIEAASVAWAPLGWRAAFFAEIDKFPRAVLAHRHPGVPVHGDFTSIGATDYGPIDVLVGGTPCQSFSIAGLRGGLGDDRGNLALEYLRLADRKRPRWLVWENVPGVLSSNAGRDFGSIVGAMVKLGYGVAWRVLDAQFVRVDGLERAVPQRRRRVFVVGCAGGWPLAASVLLERESLCGHPPPRREARKGHSGGAPVGFGGGRQAGPSDTATTLTAHGHRLDWEVETFIAEPCAPTITSNGDAHSGFRDHGGLVAFDPTQITSRANGSNPSPGGPSHPLAALGRPPHVVAGPVVRRLTPRECERLQGFPDDYTRVPWRGKPAEACPDAPRYKALGNSMAVNVMRWIGRRIEAAETARGVAS